MTRDVTPLPKTVRPVKSRKPVKRPSWVKGKSALWHRSRTWTENRAGGLCEARCGDGCQIRGNQAHHVVRRAQGGSDDAANLLWTCSWCHSHIHANPAESFERGWLRRG